MSALSDKELVKSYLSGNQAHAKLLFERYKNYVAQVIRNMENDPEVIQDLLQQTFMRAFDGLKGFQGKSSFKTWISKIAINTTRNHRNKRIRRRKYPQVSTDNTDDALGPVLVLADESGNPGSDLLDKEIKTVINAALEMLSDAHREVVTLWSEGFSYEEIGKITNTSPQTVGSRLHYARTQLQKILTPYVKEENQPLRPQKKSKK